MKIILDDFWSDYHTLLGMNIVTSEIVPNLVWYLYFCFLV